MSWPLVANAFSAEQKARLCGVLSVGCDRQTAVNLLGCSLADLRRAMQADPSFASEVCRSEASAELKHMRNVQQAAEEVKNWRASVWWLERHSPERFGSRPAGAVTTRQLKAFVEIVAQAVHEFVRSPADREQLAQQLKSLAESVDQMLRDSRWSNDASTATTAMIEEDVCESELSDPLSADGDELTNDSQP